MGYNCTSRESGCLALTWDTRMRVCAPVMVVLLVLLPVPCLLSGGAPCARCWGLARVGRAETARLAVASAALRTRT